MGRPKKSKPKSQRWTKPKKPTNRRADSAGSPAAATPARQHDNDSASSSLSPVAAATPGASNNQEAEQPRASAEESSDEEHQPAPAEPITNRFTFGDDPSTFPDPTIYEIRKVTPGMTEEEIKEIYSVASYPKDDLRDLIAGDPPDKDFSNAKPSNQVQATTFAAHLEPYFKPFTEEDLAFLRERGDRVTPFTIPRRGKKHYTEVWAEEDGVSAVDNMKLDRDKLPANQARGSMEDMDDSIAETDQVSAGPILSRLLATMRPEHRAPAAAAPALESQNTALNDAGAMNGAAANGAPAMDGDVSMNGMPDFSNMAVDMPADLDMNMPIDMPLDANGLLPDIANLDMSLPLPASATSGLTANLPPAPIPPATAMPDSHTDAWKKATHPKLDHAQIDERLKQELRYIGFLPFDNDGPSAGTASSTGPSGSGGQGSSANASASAADAAIAANLDGHFDDEIAARLRFLQAQLKEQAIVNGARKARLMEMVKEKMAFQEYNAIVEDLDGQVQTAYAKRMRTSGKNKKAKRPGGAGGGSHATGGAAGAAQGQARPGIGDVTKTVMDRRKKWIESIGPIFNEQGATPGLVPASSEGAREGSSGNAGSIFAPEVMAEYIRREREGWEEEGEEE
jgi:transcriptional adapter 3